MVRFNKYNLCIIYGFELNYLLEDNFKNLENTSIKIDMLYPAFYNNSEMIYKFDIYIKDYAIKIGWILMSKRDYKFKKYNINIVINKLKKELIDKMFKENEN